MRWENDQVPVPKSAVMVVFLANVISDSGDSSLQMMTWPEQERDRWRRFLSTKKHPVDIVAFAELRWLLDVPNPVVPTKEEMEKKYKRQARYERKNRKALLVMAPDGLYKLIVYSCTYLLYIRQQKC